MLIKRNPVEMQAVGPAEWFTGSVRFTPITPAKAPGDAEGNFVEFAPGARTAWHTHPLGQMLIIVSGKGYVQKQGGPIEEVGPGDTIWFEPGIIHWHGAAHNSSMRHIAIQMSENDISATWLEHVSDHEYSCKKSD